MLLRVWMLPIPSHTAENGFFVFHHHSMSIPFRPPGKWESIHSYKVLQTWFHVFLRNNLSMLLSCLVILRCHEFLCWLPKSGYTHNPLVASHREGQRVSSLFYLSHRKQPFLAQQQFIRLQLQQCRQRLPTKSQFMQGWEPHHSMSQRQALSHHHSQNAFKGRCRNHLRVLL